MSDNPAAVSTAVDFAAYDQTQPALHVLTLALQPASVTSLAASSAVSQLWRMAATEAFSSVLELDLRPFAANLSDEMLDALLSKTPMLRELNLSSCGRITDRGLACLPRRCPHLRDLNLACNPLVTADGVAAIADELSLTGLELAGCRSIPEAELVRRFARFLELDEDEDGLAKVQG